MPRVAVFVLFVCALIGVTGCGTSAVLVKGVLKMDGSPVEGATITFVSADGTQTYSGFSDAGGNFTLSSGTAPGAMPGSYKVTVLKSPKLSGAENMTAGNDDYLKQMQKMQKEQKSSSGINMMPKGGMMPPRQPSAPAGPKTELPAIYASANTSPLTATVSADNPVVTIELKLKP